MIHRKTEASIFVVLFQWANALLACVSISKELHTPQSSSASGQGQFFTTGSTAVFRSVALLLLLRDAWNYDRNSMRVMYVARRICLCLGSHTVKTDMFSSPPYLCALFSAHNVDDAVDSAVIVFYIPILFYTPHGLLLPKVPIIFASLQERDPRGSGRHIFYDISKVSENFSCGFFYFFYGSRR